VFGRLTDRLGRKRLFILTLALYLVASGIAAFSFSLWFLLIFRFVAGLGIGGEYTAINSAIDELIPSHYRGRVDIAINGTYWAGAMIGAAASIFLLNPDLLPLNVGWRIGLLIGPVIGLGIIYLRRHIPERPALAHDARPRGGGRADRRRHRGPSPCRGRAPRPGPGLQGSRGQGPAADLLRTDRSGHAVEVPEPLVPRLLDDGDAGVPSTTPSSSPTRSSWRTSTTSLATRSGTTSSVRRG
jgi:MFS family permease